METESIPLTQDKVHEILSVHFDYYKKLSGDEQQVFLRRVFKFINLKEFVPKENVEVAAGIDNIKTIISAAAIQLTFGLSAFELEHFSRIFIYPSIYYNSMTKHWHKGEANVVGALVFSWKDVELGYEAAASKMNLGLHEMAHALMLSIKVGEGNDPFFASYFDKWWGVSSAEYLKLEKHQTSFFRDYGGTNPQEFFSVVVECFFGLAEEFKDKHPEIYRQTCILLNQDPSGSYATITNARERLLLEKQADVIPSVETFSANSRTFTFPVYFFLLWGTFFLISGAAYTMPGITIAGGIVIVVPILLWSIMKYFGFTVYDNAFVISRYWLGKKLPNDVVLDPLQIISMSFFSQRISAENSLIYITYIDEARIKTASWSFAHLKYTDRVELRKALREFCAKYRIIMPQES